MPFTCAVIVADLYGMTTADVVRGAIRDRTLRLQRSPRVLAVDHNQAICRGGHPQCGTAEFRLKANRGTRAGNSIKSVVGIPGNTFANPFAGCVHRIQMSPCLPFTNVTLAGLRVGRRAGAEPQRSAAPERRPIDRSSQPRPLSTERAPARSARREAQPTLKRSVSR